MIVGYSGPIPEEYNEIFLRLFEQVHARNVAEVDKILIEILERILNKYPTLPDENDHELKGHIKTIVLLAFELNLAYGDWLRDQGFVEKDTNIGVENEDSSCLENNLSHLHTAYDLMVGIYRYLQGSNKLSYGELKQMLKDYAEKKPCEKPKTPVIPPEYEEMRVRLFVQIHARNVAKVDEMVIKILESFLKKYPEIPDSDNPKSENNVSTLAAMFFPFNLAYVEWLDEKGIKERDTNKNHDWESSSCLTDNVSNAWAAMTLVHDVINYMRGGNTFYYDELNQRLQEYLEESSLKQSAS